MRESGQWRSATLLAALSLGCATSASDPLRVLEEALRLHTEATTESEIQQVVPLYREAAEAGLPVAQFELARMYLYGFAVEKDEEQAYRWVRPAAEAGLVKAMTMLGDMYLRGVGVGADPGAAARWLGVAASRGDAEAQYSLGRALYDGKRLPPDDAEARRWLRAAAEQDHTRGIFYLAQMLREGRGGPEDLPEALRLHRHAAALGSVYSQMELARTYWFGDGVDEDRAEALRWFEEAARQGDPSAQATLGQVYETGSPGAVDLEAAVGWFRKAAAAGHPLAQLALARFYRSGQGVEADFVEALKWIEIAMGDLRRPVPLTELGDYLKGAKRARHLWRLEASDAQRVEADARIRAWLETYTPAARCGGCAGYYDAADVEARLLAQGRFRPSDELSARTGSHNEMTEETAYPHCEIGELFGVTYEVEGPPEEPEVYVSWLWEHPRIDDTESGYSGTGDTYVRVLPLDGGRSGPRSELWRVTGPAERVPGIYRATLSVRGREIFSTEFDLRGCPEP